jgi:predicted porin
MKLRYSLVASSLVLALPFASQAGSISMIDDMTFYGKAEIQLNQTDHGKTKDQDGLRYVDEGLNIDSPFSRIGLKGQFGEVVSGRNDTLTYTLPKLGLFNIAMTTAPKDDSNIRHSEEAEQLTIGLDYIFNPQAKAYVLASKLDLSWSAI